MHVYDALRAGLFMQGIDVLRTKKEALVQRALQFRQGAVTGIGSHCYRSLAPLGIKLPDKFGIGMESFRSGYLFHPMSAPQSIGATKCGKAAFGADPSTRQHEHPVLRCQRLGRPACVPIAGHCAPLSYLSNHTVAA